MEAYKRDGGLNLRRVGRRVALLKQTPSFCRQGLCGLLNVCLSHASHAHNTLEMMFAQDFSRGCVHSCLIIKVEFAVVVSSSRE